MLHDLLEQGSPRNEKTSSHVDNTGKTDWFNIHQPQILLDINTDTITYSTGAPNFVVQAEVYNLLSVAGNYIVISINLLYILEQKCCSL